MANLQEMNHSTEGIFNSETKPKVDIPSMAKPEEAVSGVKENGDLRQTTNSYVYADMDLVSNDDHRHKALHNVHSETQLRELQALFRPVLCLMGILGLFHPSKRAASYLVGPEYRFSSIGRWVMIAISLGNIGYMFANFVVFVVADPGVDLNSFPINVYIIMLVWLAYALLIAILHFIICEKPNRFDRIWELWAHWARIPHSRHWTHMRMVRNVYVVIGLAVAITPPIIVAVVMTTMKPGTGMEGTLKSIEYGSIEANHVWLTVNFVIISFLIFGTAAFTTVFFVTHCLVVAEELKFLFFMISDRLESGHIWDNVQEDQEEVSVLEQLRRRRLECRSIVEAMDKTFEQTAFLSVFANVPLIVFIAYGLVSHTEQSEFKKAIGVMAGIGSLLQVLAITVAAAWIYEWSAAPKQTMHTLKIHNYLKITRQNHASLVLFLSELNSEHIGISAWAFAVITKEFIATVLGLAVTYIIVLVEFRHLNEVLAVTKEIHDQVTFSGNNTTAIFSAYPHKS